MASIGKFANSFVSGTNENTLALANINLDFSLVKLEAPQEFLGLGSTLSSQRRTNAEDGPIHKTLRKLGGLFEQVVPSTPNLIKAYGLRSSEIIQTPGISPKGSKSDGPFEAFVGADGTSIWAAATSGPAAMGVHLLACMLARQFDDAKVSTAIWVELVLERQREVQDAHKNGSVFSVNTVVASLLEVSRDELAIFDASARSWLCSADEAKMSNQKKLMLILKNINVPISSGPSTYRKVIDAWKEAMTGFEDLLNGMPQQVSNGAILRALSSWYLYPNLIVLVERTVHVKFEDPLLSEQSVVTVGLQYVDSTNQQGIQWSLTLSHLRFYGNPILVNTNENSSSVDIFQIHLIAFGCLLEGWRISPKDIIPTALWFRLLWNELESLDPEGVIPLIDTLPWLSTLVRGANLFLDSLDNERETALLLVNYGRRRGRNFLCSPGEYPRPFFGLGNSCVRAALTASYGLDCCVEYYREMTKSISFGHRKPMIKCVEIIDGTSYTEFATATKHLRKSLKRLPDGFYKQEHVYARWIFSEYEFPTDPRAKCSCEGYCYSGSCECKCTGMFCVDLCHENGGLPCQALELKSRAKELTSLGEEVHIVSRKNLCYMPYHWKASPSNTWGKSAFSWHGAPAFYCDQSPLGTDSNTCSTWTSTAGCQCFKMRGEYDRYKIELHQAVGSNTRDDFYDSGLFIKFDGISEKSASQMMKQIWSAQLSPLEPAEVLRMLQVFSSSKRHLPSLHRYLRLITSGHLETNVEGSKFGGDLVSWMVLSVLSPEENRLMPFAFLRSLWALSFGRRVYEHIPNTIFPLRIVERPLHNQKWIPADITNSRTTGDEHISRAQVMACVAAFESGGFCIHPDEMRNVMAISSRNSIFVAGVLLSDPSKPVENMDIRRVIGNVGQPGITLMISPHNLLVRPLVQDFRAVRHSPYDNKRIDAFSGTSLHLSFTKWRLPLNGQGYGLIDQDIFLAEAVISVRDSGRWIADIDILEATSCYNAPRTECTCRKSQKTLSGEFVSIDSWEELLDLPLTSGIVRTQGNWAARLAAKSVLMQKDLGSSICVIDPETPCLHCLKEKYMESGRTPFYFID